MNCLWGVVAGVVSALSMIGFIGIWIWAWSQRNDQAFHAFAHMPLEDHQP